VENLELIHASNRDRKEHVQLLDKPMIFGSYIGGTLDNLADRMALCRRQVFQMSALSTIDGSIEDYHGCNG
jgi:hypothetical protein